MPKKIVKSKGLIGRLYESADYANKLMFRAELLKAASEDGTDYSKRFRDHYQYCENPREVLSIYLDLARKHLGYIDGQPFSTPAMLETLLMEQAA
ncbi:hypothetical protein [Spirosoma litoris]